MPVRLSLPCFLLTLGAVAHAGLLVPASTDRSLLVDDVTLPGFSAGYQEIGYAVFQVPPGHYSAASFHLSLGGANPVTVGPAPTTALAISLREVSPPPTGPSVTFFGPDWSGPEIGALEVTASAWPQTLTADLASPRLLAELDHGGDVGIAGIALLGSEQPNPLDWTGAGSTSLSLQTANAPPGFIPEPGAGLWVAFTVAWLLHRRRPQTVRGW